jgi:hypothetical protein
LPSMARGCNSVVVFERGKIRITEMGVWCVVWCGVLCDVSEIAFAPFSFFSCLIFFCCESEDCVFLHLRLSKCEGGLRLEVGGVSEAVWLSEFWCLKMSDEKGVVVSGGDVVCGDVVFEDDVCEEFV